MKIDTPKDTSSTTSILIRRIQGKIDSLACPKHRGRKSVHNRPDNAHPRDNVNKEECVYAIRIIRYNKVDTDIPLQQKPWLYARS